MFFVWCYNGIFFDFLIAFNCQFYRIAFSFLTSKHSSFFEFWIAFKFVIVDIVEFSFLYSPKIARGSEICCKICVDFRPNYQFKI